MPNTNHHTYQERRIYVACLACDNTVQPTGTWMNCEDADEMEGLREAMQKECGHVDGDYAIHDYDEFFGLKIGENWPFTKVVELAALLEKHGAAFAAYADDVGTDYADVQGFEEAYQGEYRDEEDFAEQYIEDLGILSGVPDMLRMYFDYEAFARDLFINDFHMVGGYVFLRP